MDQPKSFAVAAVCAAMIAMPTPLSAQPTGRAATPVILDTDMWGDIDDAFALSILHAFQDRGEAKILAITSSTADPWTAAYIDLIDAFYGHGKIPVGLVHNGVTPPSQWPGEGAPMAAGAPMYTEYVSKLQRPDGELQFPHHLQDGRKAPEAVGLLRRTLASQADGSVVIVGIGFSTNLARLLESRPDQFSQLSGVDLVKQKVRLLSVMAGRYADEQYQGETISKDRPEYNIRKDIASAQTLFTEWPTPIVASGFEVGFTMRLKGAEVAREFGTGDSNPLGITYRYMDPTYRTATTPSGVLHDQKTFDLTSVLYAVRPNDAYFALSPAGHISVLPNGVSKFEEDAQGNAHYLTIDDAKRARTLEAMTLLASQPPRNEQNRNNDKK